MKIISSVLSLFARGSGWNELAKSYPAATPPSGREFKHQTIQVGAVRYRNTTTAIVSSEGLYLATMPGHTPLLIPWEEIRLIKQDRIDFGFDDEIYWEKAVRLRIGVPGTADILLPLPLFAEVKPFLKA